MPPFARTFLTAALASAPIAALADPPRPVHRFLEIAMSPDGARVASVEGDAGPSGAIRRYASW